MAGYIVEVEKIWYIHMYSYVLVTTGVRIRTDTRSYECQWRRAVGG